MKMGKSEKDAIMLRTVLIFAVIVLAAALRLAPHPWNFTPVGAIAKMRMVRSTMDSFSDFCIFILSPLWPGSRPASAICYLVAELGRNGAAPLKRLRMEASRNR